MAAKAAKAASRSADEEADALLRQHTVYETKNIQKRTRADIERKKQELRLMVGERYRDLIAAADSINTMKSAITTVHSLLDDVRTNCRPAALDLVRKPAKSSGDTAAAADVGAGISKQQAYLFRVAGQIKILVDTPEQIWHCLEGRRYLVACQLFLVARQVFNNLQSQDETAEFNVLKRFPVVQRQWDAVKHFKTEILTGAWQFLRRGDLTPQEASETLAAVILLDHRTPGDALHEFLAARMAAVRALLEPHKADPSKPEMSDAQVVLQSLHRVIDLLVATLRDVRDVFIGDDADATAEPTTAATNGLVAQCLQALAAGGSGSGKRDAASSTTSSFIFGLYSSKTNIHLLSKYLPASVQRYTPYFGPNSMNVTLALVREKTMSFITSLQSQLRESAAIKQLLNRLATGTAFASARSALIERLAALEGVGADDGMTAPARSSWLQLCDTVLGKSLSVWNDLLRPSFNARATVLIDNAFALLVTQADQMLPPLLLKAHTEPRVGDIIWSNVIDVLPVAEKSSSHASSWSSVAARASGLVPSVLAVLQAFDGALDAAQTDLRPCFALGAPWDAAFHVAEDVQTHQELVRSSCRKAARAYHKALADLVTKQRAEATGPSDQIHLHALLMLARVSRAISLHSAVLPKLLNFGLAPSTSSRKSATTTSRTIAAAAASTDDLAVIQQAFGDLYVSAHTTWVNWVVSKIGQQMAAKIRAESWRVTFDKEAAWQVFGMDLDTETKDQLVPLPVQPSALVMSGLFQLCEQIHAVASFTLDRRVVSHVLLQLSRDLLPVYDHLVRGPAESVSDKGALQLLFDVRFLLQMLRPSWEGTDQEAELHKQAQNILRELQSRVDPINLAVFEPILIQNVERFYQRNYVLVGLLLPLHEKPADIRKPRGPAEQPNVIGLSSHTKRFIYLPISETSSFSAGAGPTRSVAAADVSSLATPTDVSTPSAPKLSKMPIAVTISAGKSLHRLKQNVSLSKPSTSTPTSATSGFFGAWSNLL